MLELEGREVNINQTEILDKSFEIFTSATWSFSKFTYASMEGVDYYELVSIVNYHNLNESRGSVNLVNPLDKVFTI